MNKGQTVGILGPNGAGKTLFYIIAGLLKCDEGKITLADAEINHKSISERTFGPCVFAPRIFNFQRLNSKGKHSFSITTK